MNDLNLKPLRELDVIRGKMLVSAASVEENHAFLRYVASLESLLDEADLDDYFGTEGWQHHLGID